MEEIITNIHIHTVYSDGHRKHADIAKAAMDANVDVIIVTDHNVLVSGIEGYFNDGTKRVLLLTGEEIHDQARQPQRNHILAIGAIRELAHFAFDPQNLVNLIHQYHGLAFLAHPNDPDSKSFNKTGISWVAWDVKNFDGIEIWNAMSEFKSLLKSKFHAIYYALQPNIIITQPFNETVMKWDELLNQRRKIVAIGGTDAHELPGKLGPFKKKIFPYEFLFRTINNHLLISDPLSGSLNKDKEQIYKALRQGHLFVGYDLPAPTKGFRFMAHGFDKSVIMGDEINAKSGITLQIRLPQKAECILRQNGIIIKTWYEQKDCTYITNETGVFRVEAFINYRNRRRAWIYSNPIYVTR